MQEQKNDKAYFKLAQLLATSDFQSNFNEKYFENILQNEGNLDYQVSANSVLGSIKPQLQGSTALHLAYKRCKLKLLNFLLSHGANFNIKNQRGSTVLHQIIEDTFAKESESSELPSISNNPFVTSVLDTLVKLGNSRDSRNEKGITHFHIACIANHKAAVEFFLKGNVFFTQSVTESSSIFPGYTAVHFAARFLNFDVMKILLEYDVPYDIKDAKGMTSLHILIKQNIEIADSLNKNEVTNAECLVGRRKINEDIIHLLLKKNPDDDFIDDTNLTRLHLACIMESSKITEDLFGCASYMNQAVDSESAIFLGNTALHFAALCNVGKVKLLLHKGANIHLLNAEGKTAFDLCLERYEIKDICEIIASQPNWSRIELSIGRGTLLDLVSCLQTCSLSVFKNREGYMNPCVSKNSPLWTGYDLRHLAVIFSGRRYGKNNHMIIENLVNLNIFNSDRVAKFGISPLHLAFRSKKAKVVNFLLTACRSNVVNLVDSDKLSHLHVACAAGFVDVVKELLLNGADVNAALQANFEWFRRSQRHDTNKDVFIPKGSTPLHIAVIVGNCEIMKVLMEYGADLYAKDAFGMTPIHWLIVSDNPILPAANILLSESQPIIGMTSSRNENKRFATRTILKECITSTGLSHLHVACFANNQTAVEQLLEDDEFSSSRINGKSFRGVDDDAKRFPGKLRYAGYSPLHFALEGHCSLQLISCLIGHGAYILTKNPMKNTIPLYEALKNNKTPYSKIFVTFFKKNEALQKHVADDVGLSMLHVYCCLLDIQAAQNLLEDGVADVNGAMCSNSPIWPGYTPLHVLVEFYQTHNQNSDAVLELLVCYGADVTLLNAEKKTPLHLAYELDAPTKLKVTLLESLLASQKYFNVNPQNSVGLSHFHIACALCDVVTIEKFLKRNVDVNEPIDHFFYEKYHENYELSGCTPLHLILFHSLCRDVEETIKIKAVTALIERGANICAENISGNTPLHLAVKCDFQRQIGLIKKIINCGGNIYAENILGQTAFEIMLDSGDVTIDGIKFFLDRGYSLNSYNPISQEGFIALILLTNYYDNSDEQQMSSITEFLVNKSRKILNEKGRTIIHNIVSISTSVVSEKSYLKIIESLADIVNIDHQDNLGRTALHIATQFKNEGAVIALLQAGTDINILDENKKTAFNYSFENSPFAKESQDRTKKIVGIFSSYVQKLNSCFLDAHEMNHAALTNAITNFNVDVNPNKKFYDELTKMKDVKIRLSTITLCNFISGTNQEHISSCILRLPRKVLDNLYHSDDIKSRFWESLGIIRLQCRKFSKSIVVDVD